MSQKVFKTGNSLAVTIPAGLVRILGLRSGMVVETRVDIPGLKVSYKFSGSGQLSLLKLAKGKKKR